MSDPRPVIDYAHPREGCGVLEWVIIVIAGGGPTLALMLLFAWEVWSGIQC